jgi:hypothetical protein
MKSAASSTANLATYCAGKPTERGNRRCRRVTGNEKLEAEGKVDQTKANVKQAGEKVKDAVKH